MSQSDVIMIISSDEEAAPPLNPSKKARKPRLHENNILMGQKDLNSPKRPRKNDKKSSAEKKSRKRPQKVTVSDAANVQIRTDLKIQALGPLTEPSSKPVIDDYGLLKQFETATALLPNRDGQKSPSRAPKVRITKRAPVLKSRDNLKDMSGFGDSESTRTRKDILEKEEVDKVAKKKMRRISNDVTDNIEISTYVKMFPNEITAKSRVLDSSVVAEDVFQDLFNKQSPSSKRFSLDAGTSSNSMRVSPVTSKRFFVTDSPENESPIDITSSPEPSIDDNSSTLPSKLTPREKLLENPLTKNVDIKGILNKKKPLQSAIKKNPAKLKTKSLDSVPGENFNLCPSPSKKKPAKKRRISIEEYKKKHGPSTKNPEKLTASASVEAIQPVASTTDKDLHNQVIKRMPKFFNSKDELEIRAVHTNAKENAFSAEKNTPVSSLSSFVPNVPTANLPQKLQETSQKNQEFHKSSSKRSINIKKPSQKDPRLNRTSSKSQKNSEPMNVFPAVPKSLEKLSCLKNIPKSPENAKKRHPAVSVEKSPEVLKKIESPNENTNEKHVLGTAESSTRINEPSVMKKPHEAQKISLQRSSRNSTLQSQEDEISQTGTRGTLLKEKSRKSVDNENSLLHADIGHRNKRASPEKMGPCETVSGPFGSTPLVPEPVSVSVSQDEEKRQQQKGVINSSVIERLDETAEGAKSCGITSILDILNCSEDSGSCKLTVEDQQKPLHKRVNEIADETEEREPDSIDDDLPLTAFIVKKGCKISENETSVGENIGKKASKTTEIFAEMDRNSVVKENKKSKNAKPKATKTPNRAKKIKKKKHSQTVDGEIKAKTVDYGTVLDSDEEEEERKRKAQNEKRAMTTNIKREIGLDMLQTQPLQDTSVTSATEEKSDRKSEIAKDLEEYSACLKILRDGVCGRVIENKPLFKTVPVNKNIRKDEKYRKTRKILSEVPISEDFCRSYDYEVSIPNDNFDEKLREKMHKKYEKLKKDRDDAKSDFDYQKGACDTASSGGQKVDETEMKKAQEKYIELDQAFDVIAADLNGRPVLEESKLEACKETSDTLFLTREIIPFVAPYRYDADEKIKEAHYKKWIHDKSGKYAPQEIVITRDTKLWEPTKSKLLGRRRLKQANAGDDEIVNMMASAFTPIGSKITKMIPWKTDNLGEKYDELVPEPVLDPKFNKELRHQLAYSPESENNSPPSPRQSAPTVNADPPCYTSDEEFEVTSKVDPDPERAVTFDTQNSMHVAFDNSPAIDSPPKTIERTKSLGPDIDFPPIQKPLNANERRASADNFNPVKITFKPGISMDNDARPVVTKSVVSAEKDPERLKKAAHPLPESSTAPQFKVLERIDYPKSQK